MTVRDKTEGTLPFQVVLRSNCTLSKRLLHDHSIDAKSVFDALIKECAGSRPDRRTVVDLAFVRETLKNSRLSHSLDPEPTYACRLDDESRPVRWERCTETLARDNSTERASWQDQGSQSSGNVA